MARIHWNADKQSVREHLWISELLPLVDDFDIKSQDKILEISECDTSVCETSLKDRPFSGEITLLNPKSKPFDFFKTINESTPSNHFDIVFCFVYLDQPHYVLPDLCSYIYHIMKPCSKLLIALPYINRHTSARDTFQQVIDSGAFPSLSQDSLIHNTTLVPNLEANITQVFSNYHMDTFVNQVEIPSLTFFENFLEEVAFIYKKVTPSAFSDEIIKMQVALFDKACKEEFDGKYMFKYELDLVLAFK